MKFIWRKISNENQENLHQEKLEFGLQSRKLRKHWARKNELEKVWEYYLKVWKKITRPIKLGKFPNEQFDVTGRMMTEMLLETVQFRWNLTKSSNNDVDDGCLRRIQTFRHQYLSLTWRHRYHYSFIFSIGTYPELSENCYMGDWTFDNSFLFMGSMATTIGYGHIVPQEMALIDQWPGKMTEFPLVVKNEMVQSDQKWPI